MTLWILNTMEPKVRRILTNKEDPHEMWKEIKDILEGSKIQKIKVELVLCRQGNQSVIDYFGKLHVLREDLTNYVCHCRARTCNLTAEFEKRRDEVQIHHFMLGLDDAIYGGVRQTIISTDLLTNMNQVYAKVKFVERIRGIDSHNTRLAFVAQMKNSGVGNEEKSKVVCTSCKKNGHTTETCFQVIGYSD